MLKIKKLIYFVYVIIFLNCCRSSKQIAYSYKMPWYAIDSANHLLSSGSYISYGNYLFEFNVRTNNKTEIYAASSPDNSIVSSDNSSTDSVVFSTHYDTMSVYLLKNESNLYFEF